MIAITAPPSKSMSHRMLIGAALARGESVLRHVLDSDDIARTRHILCAAGAHMENLPGGGLRVRGVAGQPQGADSSGTDALSCDVHESGSTCRLLTAVLAAGQGRFRIHGAPRMHERPIGALAAVLEELGATVGWEGRQGCPPFTLETRGLRGGTVETGLDESSQYLSGLLFAAPLCREPLAITLGGTRAVSWPYVGLTLQTLEDFGIPFELRENAGGWRKADWRALTQAKPGGLRFHMRPAVYAAGDFCVEGDWSGASYFLAAGAVGKHPVRVEGLRGNSLQGDRALVDILRRMGARVDEGEAWVAVHPSPLRGIDADLGHCPDLAPTVAALAAFAQGATVIRNVAHLRIKESDRIAAPAANLRAAGIAVEERGDGLRIEGGIPRPAPLFRAFGDHRIAMSAAILGMRHGPIRLDKPEVVAKSFPTFWESWESILVRG
ncbi:MAG: 3-phosphoshikimate 1-carboxyvinyltransferase [Deltaproteobacteria bacterium]|jgi:3-phosphoshikimate 1-carboxyvinyltransferase|nr:3-phosphoshikimate 1-carboxyvinyltransferase [Deltaproteobacteria bacterium]